MKLDDLIGKITCADCLDILKQLPDKCVDLVCTDCPYKVVSGGCSGKSLFSASKYLNNAKEVSQGKMFKENSIKFDDWLPEVYRVLKPDCHCYIMINGRNLAELQKQAEKAGFVFQQLLVWEKGNSMPNNWYLQSVEFILMLRKGKAKKINNRATKNILKVKNIIGNKIHPTEKPVPLMEILIANSTKENEIVLDPFAGSSPLAQACINLNRRFICIEKDPEYWKASCERLEQAQRQQTLF